MALKKFCGIGIKLYLQTNPQWYLVLDLVLFNVLNNGLKDEA